MTSSIQLGRSTCYPTDVVNSLAINSDDRWLALYEVIDPTQPVAIVLAGGFAAGPAARPSLVTDPAPGTRPRDRCIRHRRA